MLWFRTSPIIHRIQKITFIVSPQVYGKQKNQKLTIGIAINQRFFDLVKSKAQERYAKACKAQLFEYLLENRWAEV